MTLTNGRPILARPATGVRDRHRVLLAIALFALLGVAGGATYAWFHRHDAICRDGRPPAAQRDLGLGQVQFRCHDGQIVSK
jgi:hypothetical protein